MTTTDAAAARRHHPRAAIAVLLGLAGFGLMGCETGNSLFGPSVATQEPVATKPAAAQPALAKILVAPVIGAPDPIAKQIQQEFASAVEKHRVSVVANKEERADYTLRAYVVAAKDKNATKVSYIWDVTDPTGKRVNRITGEEVVSGNASKDPWAALTPTVAQNIANKAANSFIAWLPSQTSQGQVPVASNVASQPVGVGAQPIAAATASEPARSTTVAAAKPAPASQTTGSIATRSGLIAMIPPVAGAPGDGTASLTAAIQRELSERGVAVTEKPTATAFRVEGNVSIGQAKEGKQSIHIEWNVKDPQGKKVGTVSQRNEIPEGSLDGAWGQTADQAAGAAAQGIIKLLPQPTKATN